MLEKYCTFNNTSEFRWNKCGEITSIKKSVNFCRLPKLLVIHLKRFEKFYDSFTKDRTEVEYYTQKLDMSSFIHPNFKESNEISNYTLYGTIHHNGGLNYGHYHAEVNNTLGDKEWYYCSDSYTYKESPSKYSRNSVTILFYYRDDIEQSPCYQE